MPHLQKQSLIKMFDFAIKYFSPLKHIPVLPQVFDTVVGIFTLIVNKNIHRYVEEIENDITSLKGVETAQHKYGGLQFNYMGKELGHIHSNGLLDIHFPREIRDELVNNKSVLPHHVFKNSGWISFYVKTADGMEYAKELLRKSYGLKVDVELK